MDDGPIESVRAGLGSLSRRAIASLLTIGSANALLSSFEPEVNAKKKKKKKKKVVPPPTNTPTTTPPADEGHQTGDGIILDEWVVGSGETPPACTCVTYLRLGLQVIPCCTLHAKDFGQLLLNDGRSLVSEPAPNDILVLQPEVWGAHSSTNSGHIALVDSAQRNGNGTWNITLKHANWSVGQQIAGAGPCPTARLTPMTNRTLPTAGVAFYRRQGASGSTKLQIEATVIDPAIDRSIFSASRLPANPTVSAEVLYAGTDNVTRTATANVTYNVQKNAFVGVVDLGTGVPDGSYGITVKFRDRIRTIRRQANGFYSLRKGTTVNVPISLIPGDANDDNSLTNADYDFITHCYQVAGTASPCTADQIKATDIDGSGVVDLFDLNLFIRAIGNQSGSREFPRTGVIAPSADQSGRRKRRQRDHRAKRDHRANRK